MIRHVIRFLAVLSAIVLLPVALTFLPPAVGFVVLDSVVLLCVVGALLFSIWELTR
jgi:hypothetical protein